MDIKIKTPDFSHITSDDLDHIYEPSEDSFLLIDALEDDLGFISAREPRVCLEVGTGSGVVITALATALGQGCGCVSGHDQVDTLASQVEKVFVGGNSREEIQDETAGLVGEDPSQRCECLCRRIYLGTDINPRACDVTRETGRRNGVEVKVKCTDLVAGVMEEVKGRVDVLLFNPPYVVTPSEEVGQGDLEYTWAGGERGREVLDRLLPDVDQLLSGAGLFYLVVLRENDPEEIMSIMAAKGFSSKVVRSRKTGPENLSVLRFVRN